MKNKLFTLMLIVCSSLFLVNCAKNNSSGTVNPNAAGIAGTCNIAGYVNTQYGCAPQGSCPVGMGYINNSCYPAVGGVGGMCQAGYVSTQYGCLPQNGCQVNYGYYNGQCIPGSNYGGVGGVGGMCQAGYVGTQMGCLPQGTCPVNYGYYTGIVNGQNGNWCIPRSY